MSYREYQHHDAKGHFVTKPVSAAVNYYEALIEEQECHPDIADDVALVNCGYNLTDAETEKFSEIIGLL